MFACPSATSAQLADNANHLDPPWLEPTGTGRGGGGSYQWPYIADYGYNWRINNTNDADKIAVVKMSAARHPVQMPMICEIIYQNNFGFWNFEHAYDKKPATDAMGYVNLGGQSLAVRHSGGGQVLWFDGHVSYMKYEDLLKFGRTLAQTAPELDSNCDDFVIGEW